MQLISFLQECTYYCLHAAALAGSTHLKPRALGAPHDAITHHQQQRPTSNLVRDMGGERERDVKSISYLHAILPFSILVGHRCDHNQFLPGGYKAVLPEQ